MNHSIKSILSNSILIVGLAGVYADSPNARSLKNNQVIIDWNETAFNTAFASDGYGNLFYHDRARTMMHIAQHDAINTIVRKYDSYLPAERTPGANPIVAAAQAAHDVLVAAYPAQTEALDARLAEWLSGTSLNEQRMSGITVGQIAAAAIIADREGDGFDFWGTYIPGNSPGDYQYVPPFDGFVFQPGLQDARPFSLASADQLRSPDRPALTSEQYAEDYNEVKTIGSASSTVRTAEQTAYATFWYELADITWNTIARVTATEQKLDLWRTARLFALINIVTTDGYVAGWESKFYYDFWRPYTAIRGGDTDGNDFTRS